MRISKLALDIGAIEGGTWVDHIPGLGDIRLKVRGIGNADYRLLNAKLLREAVTANGPGEELTLEQSDALQRQLLLDAVLLDWDGLVDDDDNPIPFSRDQAETYLTEPRYRPIRAGVEWAGARVGDRREAQLEADVKN